MGEQQLEGRALALSRSASPLTPAALRTPDLAEVAGGAARAALGLGLSAHVVVVETTGGGTTFIGAPRLHVNEALLDLWNPQGEGMREGQTGKFAASLCLFSSLSPGLISRTPPPS